MKNLGNILDGKDLITKEYADDAYLQTPQELGFGYGVCTTAANTTEKSVTLSGYELVTNGILAIRFTNDVAANSTLNINSKGSKPIYYRGAAIKSDEIKSGDIALFIYSGSQYILLEVDRPRLEYLTTVVSSATNHIDFPSGATADNIQAVYQEGLLLVLTTNYTISSTGIELVGYRAKPGDIFTIVVT